MTEDLTHFTPPPKPHDLTLLGQQVKLTPLSIPQHANALYQAFSADTEHRLWDYLPYGPFHQFEDFQAWLETIVEQPDPYFLAIEDISTGQAIGVASFLRVNPDAGSIEVGHINFSPALQQTTLATEAMFLMMLWAFDNGYRRYEWKCNAKNLNSRRAAQRLGFSYEGVFRQAAIVKGQNRDTAWFSVIDKEWPTLKQCFLRYLSADNFDDKGTQIKSLSSLTQPLLAQRDPALLS